MELLTQIRPDLIGGVLALSEGEEIEFTVEGQLTAMQNGMSRKS